MLLMVDILFRVERLLLLTVPDLPAPIRIRIQPKMPEPSLDESDSRQSVSEVSQEASTPIDPAGDQTEESDDSKIETAPAEKSRVDWRATAKTVARSSVENEHQARALRDKMWRQSFSTMFQPEPESAISEQPILASLEFEPEFRVLGIGVTIGSCFFGVPILGVPVEQRTVGPNVIVCAQSAK